MSPENFYRLHLKQKLEKRRPTVKPSENNIKLDEKVLANEQINKLFKVALKVAPNTNQTFKSNSLQSLHSEVNLDLSLELEEAYKVEKLKKLPRAPI